jgi:hypothetical protein
MVVCVSIDPQIDPNGPSKHTPVIWQPKRGGLIDSTELLHASIGVCKHHTQRQVKRRSKVTAVGWAMIARTHQPPPPTSRPGSRRRRSTLRKQSAWLRSLLGGVSRLAPPPPPPPRRASARRVSRHTRDLSVGSFSIACARVRPNRRHRSHDLTAQPPRGSAVLATRGGGGGYEDVTGVRRVQCAVERGRHRGSRGGAGRICLHPPPVFFLFQLLTHASAARPTQPKPVPWAEHRGLRPTRMAAAWWRRRCGR